MYFCPGTDISATMPPIGVKFCTMVGRCFSPNGGDIFRGHQMRSQKRAVCGPFLACQTPLLPFDREYLENGNSQR